MGDLVDQPWFSWALVAVVVLPVATIVLTEVEVVLARRRSALRGPVHLLKTWVLPAATLLILMRQIPNDILSNGGNWVRLTATLVGFLVLVFLLSSLNTVLFVDAREGTWRQRMPRIFVDLVRVVLIGTGLAFLFSWVWGTNVAGVFAALGVTSIVLGFALQNAVGSIVSGLLLLFEQPFQLYDWLEFGGVRGRVVEVNWRSVHIEANGGIHIVPNASLAGGAFTNLSRPTGAHVESITTAFAEGDPPLKVIALLDGVAAGLGALRAGETPTSVRTGPGAYSTSLPLATLADVGRARAQFEVRLWYAARRADLRLNSADITEGEGRDDALRLLRRFAPALHLREEQVEGLVDKVDVQRYADGEIVFATGETPQAVLYVASGRVALGVPGAAGLQTILTLDAGDSFGQTTLTRTPSVFTVIARTELVVLAVPRQVVDELVRVTPALAREYGRQIENYRRTAADALKIPLTEISTLARRT